MLLAERMINHQNGTFTVQRTHANDPYLRNVERIRQVSDGVHGENRHVGRIPMHILAQWCKEEGIKWEDVQARQDMVRKKMLSGEFDKLRVWRGTY